MSTQFEETGAPHAATVEALVRDNLPLVGHLVREFLGRIPRHMSRDDLMSAGMAALAQAAASYDEARGVPFSRYASNRIRGAIVDELRGLDWASRSVRRRARELDGVRSHLSTELGRTPTAAELAERSGLSVAEVQANADDVSRASVMSLQGFGTVDVDDLLPTSAPGPAEHLEVREQVAYLRDAVELLPERLRVVVESYFFAERPMAEIAAELGVTESRISQMRAEALVLLRDALNHALEPERLAAPDRPDGCAAKRRQAYFAAVASHRTAVARLSVPTDSHGTVGGMSAFTRSA